MRTIRCYAALAWLALLPVTAHAGQEYWGYSYKNIDVTVDGTGAQAVNVTRYCLRLDAILASILGIKSSYRVPTHLYLLPGSQMQRLTGGDYGESYRDAGYSNTVLMENGGSLQGRAYYGAFFGYTATLLSSDRQLAGPDWYRVGVPSVFADSVFEGTHVKVGNITPGYAVTLTERGSMFPLRSFLSMTQRAAEQKSEHDLRMFDAQAWFLARWVFVEGHHKAEFAHYLELLRAGKPEAEAFPASFKISYEEMDKELQQAMHERVHVYVMDVPPDPLPRDAAAEPLSSIEFKARMARAYADYNHPAEAIELANAVLHEQPGNPLALRALARAQLRAKAYPDCLATLERMAPEAGSAGDYAERAGMFAELARLQGRGEAQLALDATTLKQRAQRDYQRAVAADGADLRSQEALARLDAGH